MPTLEELRAQFTTKGYTEEGFQDSPLIDFWGTLVAFPDACPLEPVPNTDPVRFRAVLNFTDLQVIEANPPYDLPIGTIKIPFNANKASVTRWSKLAMSIQKLPGDIDIGDLQGKRVHMTSRIYPMYAGVNDKEHPTRCYEVAEVQGLGGNNVSNAGTGPADFKAMIIGKTFQEFLQSALSLDSVKTNTSIVGDITSGRLIASLLADGSIVLGADGRYQKAGA